MFVGLREVGWVGPEEEAVYGGLLLMAACPQLLLSHDFHSSCWPPRTPPPAPPATYSRCSQVLGLNLGVSLPVQGLVQPSLLVVVALWGRPASAHGGILSPAVVAVRPAEQMWL